MYLGSMNTISDSVIESAQLEGAGFFTEFFHIVLPLCYSTIVTFLVVGIASIFVNQLVCSLSISSLRRRACLRSATIST